VKIPVEEADCKELVYIKKLALLSVPTTLPTLLMIAAMLVLGKGATPTWRVKLDAYVALKNKAASSAVEVQQVPYASQPWNFTAAMATAAYGDSILFPAGIHQAKAITDTILSWQAPASETLTSWSGVPLIYPPDDLFCVLLHKRNAANVQAGERPLAVLYLALHRDLYNAEWVLHESPEPIPSPALAGALRAVGCKLDLK